MPPTLILIRHAEALHNVDNKSPLDLSVLNYSIPDPELSKLGLKQCQSLHDQLRDHLPLANKTELIIVSPMVRTLQTALVGLDWLIKRGVRVEPDARWQENSDKPCDTGSELVTIAEAFPTIDFSAVDSTYPNKTSPGNPYAFTRSAVLARGQACLETLYQRPEKVITVVSHSGFLRCGVTNRRFANADYRVFEFEDRNPESDNLALKEWEMTEMNGGGMGRSEKGIAGISETEFPREVTLDERHREAVTEKPVEG
ncbi:phosphoglycerate mutase-like protein [Saccharata proteae CBS 121410]|uniref:Phosphoglycerate mutase-like protein n=1 Tax=Saccharata proteae CBS 121410 TaxID=1314787 RepID=A0A9P4HMB0_9PEZI|nr:phosphoglycerate mutase-like protein [Saccharata proteae CBS 121410]